ncbi:MAG: ribonuclease III [Gammaproteobacteria bacterium]|nr:ribonuclease III [Gammaproteobacteria bacterium]
MSAVLRYQFQNPELLKLALTHRSAFPQHNERLEFLGDALIGSLIAEALYHRFPAADEGQLTRARAALVNKTSLATIARELDLGPRLRLGEGEMKTGGWRRDSILANALEAMVGAIFLDAGATTCKVEILQWFDSKLEEINPAVMAKDPKTLLQEYLQSRQFPLPIYQTVALSGPPHEQRFTIACEVTGLEPAVQAVGSSRRQAEQEAARLALTALLVRQ